MAAVPVWAKALAVLVAIATVPWTVLLALSGIVLMVSTNAEVRRTTTFAVGQAPRLHLDASFGRVVVEAGPDGQVLVEDRQYASAFTRGAAATALRQTLVRVSRQGDLVLVGQDARAFRSLGFNWDSTITIHVPTHTDLDVANTNVLVQGIDGTMRFRDGAVELHSVVLRGSSVLDVPNNVPELHGVTIAGSTTVNGQSGVTFDGSLAPGGSSLTLRSGSVATISLPRPTDARAVVVTPGGPGLYADAAWGFASVPANPTPGGGPVTWTADLGPDPRGRIDVQAAAVTFSVR